MYNSMVEVEIVLFDPFALHNKIIARACKITGAELRPTCIVPTGGSQVLWGLSTEWLVVDVSKRRGQ